jgi:hypothetical protein
MFIESRVNKAFLAASSEWIYLAVTFGMNLILLTSIVVFCKVLKQDHCKIPEKPQNPVVVFSECLHAEASNEVKEENTYEELNPHPYTAIIHPN